MNTIFMNSKKSKTSDPHRLLLNLTNKINLRRKDKYIDLSNLNIYYTWKNIKKSHIRTINSKYQLQHGMENFNYRIDHILYQMFKIILNLYLKSMAKTINPSIIIYTNEIENKITFKIKTGCCFY